MYENIESDVFYTQTLLKGFKFFCCDVNFRLHSISYFFEKTTFLANGRFMNVMLVEKFLLFCSITLY